MVLAVKMEVSALGLEYAHAKVVGKEVDVNMVSLFVSQLVIQQHTKLFIASHLT